MHISKTDPEPDWNDARKEISDWFRRYAPSLGELYEGALKMIYAENFSGRTRFVAHSVREIKNGLPRAFGGPKGRCDYSTHIEKIKQDCLNAGLTMDRILPITNPTMEQPPDDILVPRNLWQKITTLIKDHDEARERPSKAATRLFETIAPNNNNAGDILHPIIMQWLTVTDWFMQKAHDSGRPDNEIDNAEFQQKFFLFEQMLKALVSSFYNTTGELDETLEDTNS